MKAVPLLAITNAVTLALVILLYFQQDEPRGHQRAASHQAQINEADLEDLEARLFARLKQRDSELYKPGVTPETADRAVVKDGDGPSNATAGGTDPEAGETDATTPELPDGQMETFRNNVRKAIELNREEDRVDREMQRIDRLITNNKIGALSDKQKKVVATVLLNSRDKQPRIWRQFRDNPEMREMPREERAKIYRVEFQKLRDETQKELEDVIPAADAKTILEEGMRGGDRGFTRRTVNRNR